MPPESHFETLQKTGFWGKAGAGCIFLAKDSKRFLLAYRSANVEQPHTWGCWGGAIDGSESPEEAVMREASEEAGYSGGYDIHPLYVFRKGSFSYHNFLVVVENEFDPKLDWESEGFKWCHFGKWPEPLHFGLQALFADQPSVETIRKNL